MKTIARLIIVGLNWFVVCYLLDGPMWAGFSVGLIASYLAIPEEPLK